MSATDKEIALASALVNSPCMYIPVLGAGVSSAAGIPLAHEIMMDLIGDIAAGHGEDMSIVRSWDWTAATGWYFAKFEEPATYQSVMVRLCGSAGDRRDRLSRYFEGKAAQPSPIHAALARLAREGLLRVFVTTNFDDLMEAALRQEALDPVSISSADELNHARPLHRHRAVVIHVHGQWQKPDTMRNTTDELLGYDDWVLEALSESLRSQGRLIVGWSGRADDALRTVLRELHSPRYSSFWIDRQPLTEPGSQLAQDLSAVMMTGDAHEILGTVTDIALRLRERTSLSIAPDNAVLLADESILDSATAPASLLRALSRAVGRIELTEAMTTRDFNASGGEYERRAAEIAQAAAEPCAIVMSLAMFGPVADAERWLQHASRTGVAALGVGGSTSLIHLQRLPGVLLLAAAAVGAAARNDAAFLAKVLHTVTVPTSMLDREVPLAAHSDLTYALPHRYGFSVVHAYLRRIAERNELMTGVEFDSAWDRVEVAWSLLFLAEHQRLLGWVPHGLVVGSLDSYRPLAYTWAARAYGLESVGQSTLIAANQRELAETYLHQYSEQVERIAWSHLTPGRAGSLPSMGWRPDRHGAGAAPEELVNSLARVVVG